MTLGELFKIIEDRRLKMPEGSYTTSLFQDGLDRIIQKVGEEATEVVIAAKNKDRERTVSEIADLWFHLLVLLVSLNLKPEDVLRELDSRSR